MIHLLEKIPKHHEGWVYLLWAIGTNRYKIGRSLNPVARYQTINKQSPYPIKILDYFWTVDAIADEKIYHELNADCRIHGEWFEIQDSELKFFTEFEIKLDSLRLSDFYNVPKNSEYKTIAFTYSPTINKLFFHHNTVLDNLIDSYIMSKIYDYLMDLYAAINNRDDLIYINYVVCHVIPKEIQLEDENIYELLKGLLIGAKFRLIDLRTIHEEYF
ncbi:GIY-YIG nuclease family protein [Rivularia sp. UHCC 0363]|uniref:GIY-YIG nuclease family protein n=1 Tax=Rivularia sp. UHCC 0363 TaxID=3110244 RepID=UPI002B1F1BEF|nr:GIY-YIG nuclease family protein [Rivularia sp. UHCC 0363]MEA5595695.1 GIY-YIG nuclease family protein [Rivularia sp. UHCC 0363]